MKAVPVLHWASRQEDLPETETRVTNILFKMYMPAKNREQNTENIKKLIHVIY
jgi:hypothetical protein